ncbi:MAG: TonB-dependent receptor [Chitinophagales bacterium]|nr:TonB-dependent receptor [Chitinophagales bacterium]
MTDSKIVLNNHFIRTALLIAMLFSFAHVGAQVTDTLKEVKIRARKAKEKVANDERLNTYSPGQNIITIDSTMLEQYRFQSMANLLSQQVPVFVKSYGLNNVATLNFRGASAAQSQVYWNGIPLQNAALGIADVSLLPVALMNKVNVVYGSSSALWGSGNVGGALLVENDLPDYDDSGSFVHSVSAVAASYGHYQVGLKSALSTKRFVLSANIFGQTATNDFTYMDIAGKEQHMKNAQLQSGVGLIQAGYQLNDRSTLTGRVWYQQYYREIPPALFESVSLKNQRDESIRTMLEWKRTGEKTKTYAKLAYIRDFVWYRDTTVLVNSKNYTGQVYAEAGVDHRFNEHHKLLVFTPVYISWIEMITAGDRYTQNRFALAAAYLYTGLHDKLNVSVNGRGEAVNNISYLLPGVNAGYAVNRFLHVRANVQRTYRVPTLNELYYIPGGNPSLKPERGWNEDIGYTLSTGSYTLKREYLHDKNNSFVNARLQRKCVVTHSLSVYNRVINDWIAWFGGAIWTPHNIATVHSRGLQTENKLTYIVRKDLVLHMSVNGAYTLATTTSSYLPGDGSIGKQIPYTPLYNGQGNVGATWKRFYVNYNHTYTGLRYVTTDESFSVAAYTLGNLQLMYTLPLGDNQLQLTGQCNNIWNAKYQVVNARPMPGANWLVGANFTFGQ